MSLSISLNLRYFTRGIAAVANGNELLLLNAVVGSAAVACASFCNTFFMNEAEMLKWIQVYEDKELKKPYAVSKECAKKAVFETAFSRVAMIVFTSFLPYFLISTLGYFGISPNTHLKRLFLTIVCSGVSLMIGQPFSIALFPPVS